VKKKILISAGRLTPVPGANVIITQNIIHELQNRGHEVILISIDQNEKISHISVSSNSIPVYPISSTLFKKFLELKKSNKLTFTDKIKFSFLFLTRRIKNIVNVFKFPNVDYLQSRAVFKQAEKLYKEEKYDCILSIFRPYSAVYASMQMKKKYPELICGAYYMDLISGSNKPKLLPESFYKKQCQRGDINTFSALDFILMAKGGENIYKDKAYSSVNKKITYTDFPVFTANNANEKRLKKTDRIRFVYAGTLDKQYRNPEFMLNTLKEACKEVGDITLDIYGRGNCSEIINQFKNIAALEIAEHGMVPHEKIVSEMMSADFLINISNKTHNIVPSKIFELFSMGKPIINFISNPNDISQSYFEKYPAVLNIQEWENSPNYLEKLRKFISSERGNKYNVSEIRENYFKNTPEHFVDIFDKLTEGIPDQTDS